MNRTEPTFRPMAAVYGLRIVSSAFLKKRTLQRDDAKAYGNLQTLTSQLNGRESQRKSGAPWACFKERWSMS